VTQRVLIEMMETTLFREKRSGEGCKMERDGAKRARESLRRQTGSRRSPFPAEELLARLSSIQVENNERQLR